MPNLRSPFLGDVLETVWTVDGETHQNDVRVGVGEGAETIVVLLAWEERVQEYIVTQNQTSQRSLDSGSSEIV